MTSRWVVEVTPLRNVPVRWRAYSLAVKNADVDVPEPYRTFAATSQGALRVVEAVWADHGDEPIGRLYTEIGIRFHLQSDISPGAVTDALAAAGLDRSYAAAAADERWDAEIQGSMAEAIDHVGGEVGVPILVFRDGDATAAIFGPVVSPTPRGDEALALWDQVVTLAWSPSFYELKRSRTGPPEL
ncbi:MAG: disulfide bond formation protein DsbA [Acidimicrobiales bacterium]